jgi:hypothetical protein
LSLTQTLALANNKSAYPDEIQNRDPECPVDDLQSPADGKEDDEVHEEMFAIIVEQRVGEVAPQLARLLAAKKKAE